MSLTSSNDYKDYLRLRIATAERRGYQGELARAAGCKTSYLSQVLNAHAHLTPDHAAGLVEHWGFSDLDEDYFMTLVHYGRAATPRLRQRLKQQLDRLRDQNANLTRRFRHAVPITEPESMMRYYASWHTVVLHMFTGIPAYQTPQALAERLGLSLALVERSLEDLRLMGLVVKQKGRWQRSSADIHLGRTAPLAPLAHSHWLKRAEARFTEAGEDSLFYGGVHTLAFADVDRVRSLLVETLDRIREMIRPSPDEEGVCLVCDFFRL